MSLASAGSMFTNNWLKPFATFLSPIILCPLLLNSAQHIFFLLCLLIRLFIIFHVSFMFPLFASKISVKYCFSQYRRMDVNLFLYLLYFDSHLSVRFSGILYTIGFSSSYMHLLMTL